MRNTRYVQGYGYITGNSLLGDIFTKVVEIGTSKPVVDIVKTAGKTFAETAGKKAGEKLVDKVFKPNDKHVDNHVDTPVKSSKSKKDKILKEIYGKSLFRI